MNSALRITLFACLTVSLIGCSTRQPSDLDAQNGQERAPVIKGLAGSVSDYRVAVPARGEVGLLSQCRQPEDIDLKRMAGWAMNYLIKTPRQQLGYEPVFQCHPLRCPPVPEGQDPVVSCDTDARMDWEWYYMREISGSEAGREVEAAFHKRMRDYVDGQGRVWSAPGCYNEGNTNAKYGKNDAVIHIWGATKILKSLSEDYARTGNPESRDLARKVMLALKKLATWNEKGECWFACGMGAFRSDGSVVPNGWNAQPAPIVEPLVTYYLATQDREGLDFARAYARGIMNNCQPDGVRFDSSGVPSGGFSFGAHSHATMHAIWGLAHLGLVTGEQQYTGFAKGTFGWLLGRGTGTGWFPAGPDNCNETCAVSDMMSVAALIARSGDAEYFDYVERYLRNYISNLQFIVTPAFEAYYREINKDVGEERIRGGLDELRKFQGGIIGGSGLNDYENTLLGGASGFEMFGCCAPEGMRAIYTAWSNTIDRYPKSPLGPAGIYVNMGFSRDSAWGSVVSFMPEQGRVTVVASAQRAYFVRPPHWATREQVRTFVNAKSIPVAWSGDYVRFNAHPGDELTVTYPLIAFTHSVEGQWKNSAPNLKMTFDWLGNMVVNAAPPGGRTPLFTGKPRVLPPPLQ